MTHFTAKHAAALNQTQIDTHRLGVLLSGLLLDVYADRIIITFATDRLAVHVRN